MRKLKFGILLLILIVTAIFMYAFYLIKIVAQNDLKDLDNHSGASAVLEKDKTESSHEYIYTYDYISKNTKSIPLFVGLLGESPKGELLLLACDDNSSKQPGLYSFNPETGEIHLLSTATTSQMEIYDAAYEDKWLIYSESSPDMIRADWTIWAKHLNGATHYIIAAGNLSAEQVNTATMTLLGPKISISKGAVVWSTYEKVGKRVVTIVEAFDINLHERKVIDIEENTEMMFFGHPDIDYPYVVYDHSRLEPAKGGAWGRIILFNMNTNESQVLDEGLNYGQAQVYFPYVVWMAGRYKIKLYDLRSREYKLIKTSGGECWHPMLNGQVLTWLGGNDDTLPLYYLPSGPHTVVSRTRAHGLVGDYLYWYPLESTITNYIKLRCPRKAFSETLGDALSHALGPLSGSGSGKSGGS